MVRIKIVSLHIKRFEISSKKLLTNSSVSKKSSFTYAFERV